MQQTRFKHVMGYMIWSRSSDVWALLTGQKSVVAFFFSRCPVCRGCGYELNGLVPGCQPHPRQYLICVWGALIWGIPNGPNIFFVTAAHEYRFVRASPTHKNDLMSYSYVVGNQLNAAFYQLVSSVADRSILRIVRGRLLYCCSRFQ